jgi:transmembrane sensor
MSSTVSEPVKITASEIDLRASAWIERRDRGNWDEEDETDLTAWLDENPANRITFWRMEAAWRRTERLAALQSTMPNRTKGALFFRIAAAMVLVFTIAGGIWYYISQPVSVTYTTSIGGHETVMLADGSHIELNTDTAIRLSDTAASRKIWLEKGEAFFEITHNAARPLTVFAGSRRITDLGTSFVIRRDQNSLEVSVIEGRVSFRDDTQKSNPLRLGQGDSVTALENRLFVTRKSPLELSNELGWRQGVIVFNNTSLADAAEQVSRYNVTKVAIAGKKLGQMTVTGTVSATNPQEFLRMVRVAFGLRTEKVDDEFIVSR